MSKLLQVFDNQLQVENFNNDFLLLRSTEKGQLAEIGKAIYKQQFVFIDEVIVTETEICLKLNGEFETSRIDEIAQLESAIKEQAKSYILPVFFEDSEDWVAIEKVVGLKKKAIISKLENSIFTIAMFGFLPGFLYFNGLEPDLHVPRKKVPSKYVKANSLAIGGKYLGLYSLDSPGGWHVVGKIPFSILKLPNLPPLDLNLGDEIQLRSIPKNEFDRIVDQKITLISYNA